MARFTPKLPDDLMIQLEKLSGQVEPIVEKVLKAGAEIVEEKARANLKNSLSGESSGQLLGALGTSPVKRTNDDGWDIKIGFAEPRQDKKGGTTYKKKLKSGKVSEYQLTNAMVANILEYGRKGKQSAKPFMKPARDASRAKVSKAMNEVFTAEAQKIVK
jgi:HK97 gp10 family phage protein